MKKNSHLMPLALALGISSASCGHAETTRGEAPTAQRTLYLHVEGMKKAKGGAT